MSRLERLSPNSDCKANVIKKNTATAINPPVTFKKLLKATRLPLLFFGGAMLQQRVERHDVQPGPAADGH